MFHDSYPMFSRDMILKAEMLENLKMYPRNFFEVIYKNYSDGVIAGADLEIINGKSISVQPGIIKYNGVLYHLEERMLLENYEIGKEQVIRVHFKEREEDVYELRNETVVDICSPEEMGEHDIELGHFVLKDGAILRQDYQDFKDMSTTHNTINVLNVPYAMTGGESTLSPVVMYQFAKEMLNCNLTDGYDISMTILCMQQQPISRYLIEKYLAHRIDNLSKDKLNNQQIHSYLVRAVELAKSGKDSSGAKRGMGRRMLVD